MNQSKISRRSLLKGTGVMSATAILAAYPGARLVRAQGSAEYDLIDFGPFEVEVTSGPTRGRGTISGINEAGMVCGMIGVSETRFSPATWSSKGKLKRLKSGKLGGQALDINDDGVVVGHEFESEGEPENRRPVVWRDGEPIELPDLNGDSAGARGAANCINNDGVIGGEVRVENVSQAVLWIDDVAQPLSDAPEGSALSLRGLNNSGTALASVSTGETGFVRTFGLWRGDDVVIFEFPDEVTEESRVLPQKLNDRDEALFIAWTGNLELNAVFFFTTDGETTTVVDSRDDGFGSIAVELNDAGIVVGYTYADEISRAALWEGGEIRYLDELIAADSGLTFTNALAINNAGMIAGLADDGEGIPHGFLLIPAS